MNECSSTALLAEIVQSSWDSLYGLRDRVQSFSVPRSSKQVFTQVEWRDTVFSRLDEHFSFDRNYFTVDNRKGRDFEKFSNDLSFFFAQKIEISFNDWRKETTMRNSKPEKLVDQRENLFDRRFSSRVTKAKKKNIFLQKIRSKIFRFEMSEKFPVVSFSPRVTLVRCTDIPQIRRLVSIQNLVSEEENLKFV